LKKKKKKKNKVLIIHGPNLHLLGKREKNIYGSFTLKELEKELKEKGKKLGLEVINFQSNFEGEIVEKITKAEYDFLIINPAGYTHTSVTIRDAILAREKPTIEVHISNIFSREPFRQKSLISDAVKGVICGLGKNSYFLALEAAQIFLSEKR